MSVTASLITRAGERASRGERVEHRVAEAALDPVVLDHDEQPGLGRGVPERRRVDRLDAVAIDDARLDAVGREPVGGARGTRGP